MNHEHWCHGENKLSVHLKCEFDSGTLDVYRTVTCATAPFYSMTSQAPHHSLSLHLALVLVGR
jgi:hypothetical protein